MTVVGKTKPHIGTCGKWWCEEHRCWHPGRFGQVTYRRHIQTFLGPVRPSSPFTVQKIREFKEEVDRKLSRLDVQDREGA